MLSIAYIRLQDVQTGDSCVHIDLFVPKSKRMHDLMQHCSKLLASLTKTDELSSSDTTDIRPTAAIHIHYTLCVLSMSDETFSTAVGHFPRITFLTPPAMHVYVIRECVQHSIFLQVYFTPSTFDTVPFLLASSVHKRTTGVIAKLVLTSVYFLHERSPGQRF